MLAPKIAAHQSVGLVLGPAIAVLVLIADPPQGLSADAWVVAAVACLMAIWWATEAIPLAITALLPLALFPLLGVAGIEETTETYGSASIYLLLGGFVIALGLERWNLHKRIALAILTRAGAKPVALIGGFMLVTALTSMWVSNTSSTLMMLPIALSIAAVVAPNPDQDRNHRNFNAALLLGIAYAASIGGLGTLVGSPPNAMMVGYLHKTLGVEVSFATWAMFGMPFVAVVLPGSWLILTRLAFPMTLPENVAATDLLRQSRAKLGPMSAPEYRILAVFTLVAAAWIFRPLLNDIPGLGGLSDAGIAVLGALVLFLMPSGTGEALMNWETARKLPWDVLLLYGGSISLAAMVSKTGLASWLGSGLLHFTTWPTLALLFLIVAIVIALSELLNNSAALAAFLPIIGALTAALHTDPLMLGFAAVMAASCGFMLPVATPPNTIVFGTGKISLGSMLRGGFGINLLALICIPLLCYLLVVFFIQR